jgi:hypothetical protein
MHSGVPKPQGPVRKPLILNIPLIIILFSLFFRPASSREWRCQADNFEKTLNK